MILIDSKPLDTAALLNDYPEGSAGRLALTTMADSAERYSYESPEQLKFELRLRGEIVKAADDLNGSRMAFEVFRESRCNPEFWRRREDGGFELRSGDKASDAVRDIYRNSGKYGTECATAMVILHLKALLEIFPEETYNRMFRDITLMNWNDIPAPLRGIGSMRRRSDYPPGDRRYFANPDVDPATPEWQGENVIVMGDGTYYGHGIGKHHAQTIIRALNENRREDADRGAYLMDAAARPNYRELYEAYARAGQA
jgi:protein-glutamine gamma-glutamyltransferase